MQREGRFFDIDSVARKNSGLEQIENCDITKVKYLIRSVVLRLNLGIKSNKERASKHSKML